MSDSSSEQHDDVRQPQHTHQVDQGVNGPDSIQVGEETPKYAASMLHDPRLEGRGNGQVRTALMQQMQRMYGNRAVQRYLQRTITPTAEPAESEQLAHVSVQRQDKPDPPPDDPKKADTKDAVSEEDQKEFDLLKGKIEDKDAKAYVEHRNTFFGSKEEYDKFAKESDKELDDTKGLRKQVELTGDTQTVFYRWVRKAYMNAGVTDVPKMISQGMTKETTEAVNKVKTAYGKAFSSGGFNPRPMKNAKYKYRLGTLSEHAKGNALDVESTTNPIISAADWKFIETIADKKVDRSRSLWTKTPEVLWQDIYDLNEAWKTNIATKIADTIKADAEAKAKVDVEKKAKPEAKPEVEKKVEPEAEVKAKAEAEKKAEAEAETKVFKGHKDLKKWKGGFFTLPKELVIAFHKEGFTWGATFSNADLHHFELPEKAKTPATDPKDSTPTAPK